MPLSTVLWTENKERYKLWDTVLFMNGNNRYECNNYHFDRNIDFIELFSSNINLKLFVVVYFVVQFFPWFKFYFPLFLGMLMYDNEFKTKENKI